ncbi:Hypothetical_protein [Hexamita inflata]|uniref:Hypothetical_protein n=1 Tax=Hexamita inflata TaxID=28002 RepID=A0AA86P781_9EUKA|nr:Hypothetical protein HINF_LOCUS19838 [Hexamita inflata]
MDLQIVNVNINLIIIVRFQQSKCVFYYTPLVRRRQRVVWRHKYLSILYSKQSLFQRQWTNLNIPASKVELQASLNSYSQIEFRFYGITEMINATDFRHVVFYFSEINLQAKLLN